jgi:diaminopimelate decarboxylase/aspartate kinase
VDTGFNSLIRPTLYGAYHHIVNLSRLHSGSSQPLITAEIVGNICESGDVFGHAREMPADTQEGDILLIATAGAYGHSMASHYNLREPASELYLAQEHSGGGQGKTLGLS